VQLTSEVCLSPMIDRTDDLSASLSDPIGLCAACRHARVVQSSHGSTFYRCQLAETDPRYARYPRLPVLRCAGYAPVSEARDK
jgi:hypothetical protein